MFHQAIADDTLGEPFKASVEMTFKGSDVVNINAKTARTHRQVQEMNMPQPDNRKFSDLLDSSEKYKSNYMH